MKNKFKNTKLAIGIALIIPMIMVSCVSNKKFTALEGQRNDLNEQLTSRQQAYEQVESKLEDTQSKLTVKEVELFGAQQQARSAKEDLRYLRNSNTLLLDRLGDLSVVSKTGVESIKKSLEALEERNEYIRELTSSLRRTDSVNLMLVMNLKRSLNSFDDEDVTIEVKKGVVYVSLSDKLLFRSGSSEVTLRAQEVLGKIASVVNDHKDLDLLVEGHTDNVDIGKNMTGIKDNWDLSAQRAISVVRVLQDQFQVNPARLTAAGRSKYLPKRTNATVEGRGRNRRTEIIILPKLDEFFTLLAPQMMGKITTNN
ncbi:MAG: chemotaxis protein MotB [Nonlabens sp.]|jgi:chemotaxis protein MotB